MDMKKTKGSYEEHDISKTALDALDDQSPRLVATQTFGREHHQDQDHDSDEIHLKY